MTDSSSWKLIRLRSFIPIRSHARRNSAVLINLERHGRFVTDKCFMRLTERNRRNYGFYIKPVRDFRKLRRRNIRVRFRPIRKTPGFCGFWKGYRLPSIQVNLHFWFLIGTVAVSASDKVCQWTRVSKEACAFSNVEVNCIPLGSYAWFRRRSTHVPNLTDKLSAAKERRLNQFGAAVLVRYGKLNLGSTHGAPSESDVKPVSLQSLTYSVRFCRWKVQRLN